MDFILGTEVHFPARTMHRFVEMLAVKLANITEISENLVVWKKIEHYRYSFFTEFCSNKTDLIRGVGDIQRVPMTDLSVTTAEGDRAVLAQMFLAIVKEIFSAPSCTSDQRNRQIRRSRYSFQIRKTSKRAKTF